MSIISLVERGLIPDWLTRMGIRRLCRQRLREVSGPDCEADREQFERFIAEMNDGPVAPVPEKANEQHYELPAAFFNEVLGPHRKYSCCWWPEGTKNLGDAEARALAETCRRADLTDGQDILELGCGWGSLTLWMAEHFRRSRITAVSNSAPQRRFIEGEASRRGLTNVKVVTQDMNRFEPAGQFDRVVSVEMFEHMRNYRELFRRISCWLRPAGKLFIHIFCHRDYAYEFETEGEDNWMGRYFFTGGIMPSDGLPARFQEHLRLCRQWRWDGRHYARTSEAWLANLDRRRDAVLPILMEAYGPVEARRWFHRWRMFFLAVAELFAYEQGRQWWVGHYLFESLGRRADSEDIEQREDLREVDLVRS